MTKILVFGKNKGKALERCEESYIKWLATHKAVLKSCNQPYSDDAKQLLEENAGMTYEEYQNEILYIMWDEEMSDSEISEKIAKLESQYPQYATRANAEADANRSEQKSVSQETSEKAAIFVLRSYKNVGSIIEDDGHQYRVVEDSSWMSAREAAEIAEFADAGTEFGWYTKAVLVA